MKNTVGIGLLALALGTLGAIQIAPAFASRSAQETREVKDSPSRRYKQKNGSTIRGTVIETDGNRVRIRVSVAGGTGTAWYTIDRFTPESQVDLRRAITEDSDLSGQLAVAEFAMDNGLIEDSKKQLRRAALLADDYEENAGPDFKPRALTLIDRIVVAMVDKGDVRGAESAVSRLLTRHGSDLTEAERVAMVENLEKATGAQKERAQEQRRAELDEASRAKIDKAIEPILKNITEAEKTHHKALLGSRKRGNALRECDRAIKKYDLALKGLEKLVPESSGDRALVSELAALAQRATTGRYDALLTSASLYLTRGQFNASLERVNTILADDPKNKEAKAMRARIEVAANDWGWWR
ncbi:MAG: hypothetical protein AAF726_11915 [Planctomycetota bacterium]